MLNSLYTFTHEWHNDLHQLSPVKGREKALARLKSEAIRFSLPTHPNNIQSLKQPEMLQLLTGSQSNAILARIFTPNMLVDHLDSFVVTESQTRPYLR